MTIYYINDKINLPLFQGPTITLPAGLHLPPGTVLMKNEQGQLVFVSQQGAPIPAQAAHGQPATVKVQAVRVSCAFLYKSRNVFILEILFLQIYW